MSLYIVKKIVESCGGSLSIKTDNRKQSVKLSISMHMRTALPMMDRFIQRSDNQGNYIFDCNQSFGRPVQADTSEEVKIDTRERSQEQLINQPPQNNN